LIGAVILGLAGIYFLASRNQNARGRHFQGTLTARYLSRGAVELVRHAVRDYAHPTREPLTQVDPARSFLDLAMTLPSTLKEDVALARAQAGSSDRADDRKLLDRLFGKGLGKLLDQLESSVPGAEVRVYLDFEVSPFPGAPEGYSDPVPKGMTVQVRAEARWGGATREALGSEAVVVYPVASPLMGRFTGNTGFTWHEDGASLSDRLLDSSRPDLPLLADGTLPGAGKLQEAYRDRGWAYPRHQMILPGGGLDGLHHLLWKPEGGRVPIPRSLLFPDLPPTFGADFLIPGDPLHFQRPLLEGLVQGSAGTLSDTIPNLTYPFAALPGVKNYYQEDPDTYPAPEPNETGPGPFGTPLDPSPTFAPGSRARLFAVSALTIDRDRTSQDEDDQMASAGVALPFREAFGYLLPQIPEDLGGYDPSLGPRLPEFPPGSGRGLLENRNQRVDLDDDGVDEFVVPSEVPYATLDTFVNAYSLENLLPDATSFSKVGSRSLDIPVNYLLELSTMTVVKAQERLHELAWGDHLDELKAWEELPYGLHHTDPLHLRGKLPGDTLHWGVVEAEARAQGEAPKFLTQLKEMEVLAASRWMPTAYVFGLAGLEKFFPGGDLRGFRVQVLRDKKDGPSYLKLAKSYHSGVLVADLVEVSAEVAAQGEGELLEVFAQDVVLGAVGESHLMVFAPSTGFYPVSKKAGDPARLRGAVFTDTQASLVLGGSGNPAAQAAKLTQVLNRYKPARMCVSWDARRNPLGAKAHRGYRVAWAGLR
jgi:hypothetical protein